MTREPARSFAERLPPVVEETEADLTHLSDDMVDVLYPGRRPRPFRMAIVFEAFDGDPYERALALARQSPVYREMQEHGRVRHHAGFETTQAVVLRDLYELVGQRAGTDVLVDGKKVPYAREIWLPLFWVFALDAPACP